MSERRRLLRAVSAVGCLGFMMAMAGPACRKAASESPAVFNQATFEAGRAAFHGELQREIRFHERAFSLKPGDRRMILEADARLPGLYESVVNLLSGDEGRASGAPAEAGSEARSSFRAAYLELCRRAAREFIGSLFVRETEAPDPDSGRTPLDWTLMDLGIGSGAAASSASAANPIPAEIEKSAAFRLLKLPAALRLGRGRGVRIAVIRPVVPGGPEGSSVLKRGAPWEDGGGIAWAGNGGLMASIAAAVAPEAEIKSLAILRAPGSPCASWSARQAAQAIEEALGAGVNIIVFGTSYGMDYPVLRAACLRAHRANVMIVCPAGDNPVADDVMSVPRTFPADYATTIAVAAARIFPAGRPLAPAEGQGSRFTDFAAPGQVGGEPGDGTVAAAFGGGVAALVSSLMPVAESDLRGQYFERLREVLVGSADAGPFGFEFFDPRVGYGLLDAEMAVGERLEAYKVKSAAIDENMKKRLAERAKVEEESARAQREAAAGAAKGR